VFPVWILLAGVFGTSVLLAKAHSDPISHNSMWGAMLKTHFTDTQHVGGHEVPFDLAGEWLPVWHDKWYNRLPGKHSQRARSSSTKMTFDSDGNGSGWVGEIQVDWQVRSIAPGQYSATFHVKEPFPWTANDGHFTLLEDGTLQVQFPSHGIREYWRHADGRAAPIPHSACPSGASAMKPHRKIDLVFNSFGDSLGLKHQDGIMWHWGLRVDESIYEVGGMQSLCMAVVGPNGVVATSSLWAEEIRTNIKKFDGYLTLSQKASRTDQEIEEFTCRWVKQHPAYNPLGPNCQTYVADLFIFLTGEDLPFAKSQDKVANPSAWVPGGSKGLDGPEVNPSTVWMRPDKKPLTTPEDGRPHPAGPGGQSSSGALFASALLGGIEKLAQAPASTLTEPSTTPEDGRPHPAGPGGQPFSGALFASALLGGLERLAQRPVSTPTAA
jgi:hypothetical protein